MKEVSNYNYLIGISMFAEIITIGDELLIGQVVDTNSAWMGRELNKVGIEVIRVVSVRDRADEITEAVDDAMNRADIVLMTGGLAPFFFVYVYYIAVLRVVILVILIILYLYVAVK